MSSSTPARDREMVGMAQGSGSGSAASMTKMKGSWSPEEDEMLKGAVARHGARNWTAIGEEVPGRSGKSCRLRWCNQLSPAVHRRPFSPEEDALIVAAHSKYGNKWATIARLLHGRTDNSVKNHWNSSLRRNRRAAAAAAANASVSYQSMDLTEEDDDRTSDDSVAVPPPSAPAIVVACVPTPPPLPTAAKRLCAAAPQADAPASPPAKKLCVAAPPADPPTSLSLSPPGGGVEAPAPVAFSVSGGGDSSVAVASEIAMMLQDPWLMAMMRQMVAEEVQRHMGMVYSLMASSAAVSAVQTGGNGGGAGGVGRNGPDGGRPSNSQD